MKPHKIIQKYTVFVLSNMQVYTTNGKRTTKIFLFYCNDVETRKLLLTMTKRDIETHTCLSVENNMAW